MLASTKNHNSTFAPRRLLSDNSWPSCAERREIGCRLSDFDHFDLDWLDSDLMFQFNDARNWASHDAQVGSPGANASAPSNSSIARFTIPLAA